MNAYGHILYRVKFRQGGIAGKSTCCGSEIFEAHTKGGNNDGVYRLGRRRRPVVGSELPAVLQVNGQVRGLIVCGSSPMRGKTLISNHRRLAEVSPCGKDFRR